MGGIGSGTWYRWNRKPTCETVIQIDIRELHRADALRPGQSGDIHWESDSIKLQAEPDHLILMYRYQISDGLSHPVLERVTIDRTPCNFGGTRPWFQCPDCNRRVAVLYAAGVRFLCRQCYCLPYTSQMETKLGRLQRKAAKIRERLGDDGESVILEKPKRMHWATFEQLVESEQKVSFEIDRIMAERLAAFLGWAESRVA